MNKQLLLTNLSNLPNFEHKEIIKSWITCLPADYKFTPKTFKKGDILYAKGIKHYLIVYSIKKCEVICLMLTTSPEVGGYATKSRSLDGYINQMICIYNIEFVKTLPFCGIYDNNSHLNEIYNLIKSKI